MVFRKRLLSSSVALALIGTAVPAFSQDEGVIEEIIVQGGIRGSLKASMDIKRDSMGVVDAISAEDIGKFPDANLAESLQRITGVSISRSRGEGSQVTVRGFGPEYNLVTLNGRQMPTHNGQAGRLTLVISPLKVLLVCRSIRQAVQMYPQVVSDRPLIYQRLSLLRRPCWKYLC